jgi:hypothetical protein
MALPHPGWLLAPALACGAAWVWLGWLGEPARPGAASAALGGLIALLGAVGSAAAARWGLRRGPQALLRVRVLGVPARMAFIGSGVALASRVPGLRPVPFATVLLAVYLAAELWVTLAQRRSLDLQEGLDHATR